MNTVTWKGLIAFAVLSAPVVANADAYAYLSTVSGNFGTLDLSTGAFTLLGNSGQSLDGLADFDGVLYGASFSSTYSSTSTNLYTINPSNGSLSPYATVAGDLVDFGSTTNSFYGIDTNGDLLQFKGGSSEQIIGTPGGLTYLLDGATTAGLSTNGAALYFAVNSNLYTVSTTTGVATLVGSTGGAEPYAMVELGGTLYAGEYNTTTFDTLSTVTGAATTGPTRSGTGVGTAAGLVPYPLPVPVPASAWLVLSGLCGLGLVLASRRRDFGVR